MSAMPAVLVVEDEDDLLATYRRLFARGGLRVVTAATRAAGLAALAREPFEAAVVDVRLPDGDGLEVVRTAHQASPPTPVIVVTGFPSRHARQAALAAGAAAVVAKPFDAAALAARVRTLASSASSSARPAREPV
jgi:DNA-binding response OmpR family regulator